MFSSKVLKGRIRPKMQLGPKAMNAMQKEILEKDLKATHKLRKCRLLRTSYIDSASRIKSTENLGKKRKDLLCF